MPEAEIKAIFTDVGGVLRAPEQFHFDPKDADARHHLTFDTYEIGKLSLDAYLDRTVFHEPREFSKDDLWPQAGHGYISDRHRYGADLSGTARDSPHQFREDPRIAEPVGPLE